jgi:hypothetical protein
MCRKHQDHPEDLQGKTDQTRASRLFINAGVGAQGTKETSERE